MLNYIKEVRKVKFYCASCRLFFSDRLGTRVSSPARRREKQVEITCADCDTRTAKERALAQEPARRKVFA